MSDPPKGDKKKSRGEIVAVKRLLPYLKPYVPGLLGLVLVTLAYSASDAGRAWLVKPLLNHVLLRGSGAVETAEDLDYAEDADPKVVEAWRAEASKGVAPGDEKDLNDPALGLGEPVVKRVDAAKRKDKLVQLLERTRALIGDAVDQVTSRDDLEGRNDLLKAIAFQRKAQDMVRPDPTAVSEATRKAAGKLSLDAREKASKALFAKLWDELVGIFLAALGIAFTLALSHFGMFYVARAIVTKVVVDIQNKLADHLLTLSIRYFNQERRGELFSRLTNDLQNLQAVLMLLLSDILIQPIRLIVLASLAVYICLPLSLSLLVLALTVVVPVRVWGKRIRRSARSRQASVANVLEAMQQMFAGIRIVKAFRREGYEMDRFKERTAEYCRTAVKVVRDRTASKSWMEFVNDVTVPVVLLLGGVLVIRQWWGLDIGRFGVFMGCVLLMYMPAKTLAASYNTFQDSLPSVDRVFEILDLRPEIVDAPDAVALGPIKEAVRFEDVSFGYLADVPVLRNVTFTARAGQVTAIVGPTTAGKSTLVDLIARFYDPTAGRVTIDGVDLRGVKLASLLDKIAVVSQEPFLFNATIKENIRYGKLDATDAEIEAAARAARIHDDIVRMEQGYDTNVGERGAKLSGGQRQRITIARAVLKNAEILILDEAMSSLDATTEREVQEALEQLEQGRTTFAIAHRLSTVQHAHKILVLNEGRLVEEGTHDDLVARGGLYASLVKALAMPGTVNGNGVPAPPVKAEV